MKLDGLPSAFPLRIALFEPTDKNLTIDTLKLWTANHMRARILIDIDMDLEFPVLVVSDGNSATPELVSSTTHAGRCY